MGGKGSGRLNKTDTFLKSNSNPYNTVGNVASVGNEVMVVPNHSGDHSAGRQLVSPTTDYEIANKKYVDDNATSPRGSEGEIQFNESSNFQADSNLFWDNVNKILKLGGNLDIPDTTTSALGIITKNSTRYIHNFHHPTGSTAIPQGLNIFMGEDAGNFTMGSSATSQVHGSKNVGIGKRCLISNTTGYQNFALGTDCLRFNTTGIENIGIGVNTLGKNKTGSANIAIGREAMAGASNASECDNNTVIGRRAGFAMLTGADNNLIFGYLSGQLLTTGANNVLLGYQAGGQLTTESNKLFIDITNTTTPLLYGEFDNRVFKINGNLGAKLVTKTGAYTAAAENTILCDATSAAFTITLPAASASTDRIYNIKKIDSSVNAITIDGNASETVDGATTQIISSQYDSITIHCDGTGWYII